MRPNGFGLLTQATVESPFYSVQVGVHLGERVHTRGGAYTSTVLLLLSSRHASHQERDLAIRLMSRNTAYDLLGACGAYTGETGRSRSDRRSGKAQWRGGVVWRPQRNRSQVLHASGKCMCGLGFQVSMYRFDLVLQFKVHVTCKL